MLNRRQAMQFIAAVSAGAVALPKSTDASTIFQPMQFAEDLSGRVTYEMAGMGEADALDFQAPVAKSDYDKAHHELLQAVPELRRAGFDHPFTKMIEAATAMTNEAYATGARHGAAIEALRRELIGPIATCPTCWGWGVVEDRPNGRGGIPLNGQPSHVCATCQGAGTIPAALLDEHKAERARRSA